ncbi:MAG: hypothetical protein ACRDRL_27970 [Sciscionella sp.]
MLHGLANWWDGVELWLTQLAFPVQFVLVMVVLLPLCAGVSRALDAVVEQAGIRFLAVRRRACHTPDEVGETAPATVAARTPAQRCQTTPDRGGRPGADEHGPAS